MPLFTLILILSGQCGQIVSFLSILFVFIGPPAYHPKCKIFGYPLVKNVLILITDKQS